MTSSPMPPAAERRAQAGRQRRSKQFVMILLVAGMALVIVISPEPEGPGSKLGTLLSFAALGLAVLIALVVLQWTWRPRFVLRRGGLLGALWSVAVLLWYSSPGWNTPLFIIQLILIGIAFGVALIVWRRQRTAAGRDPTPDELERLLAQQQTTAEKNRETNPTAAAGAYYNSGLIEQRRGHLDAARQALEKAQNLCIETGDTLLEANCLNALGQIADDPRQCLASYEQALALLRQEAQGRFRWQNLLGLDSLAANEVIFLNNIGSAQLKLEQPAQAIPPLEEALALYRRHKEPRAILSSLLINLGLAHAGAGDREAGRPLAAKARAELDAAHGLGPAELSLLRGKLDELTSLLAASTGDTP